MISCPACDGTVLVAATSYPSEIVECGDCRSELEVVSVSPLMVALAPEVEEDWGE